MSANVEGMVREGINAFKAGKKDEARVLLSKAVELDPYNEDGWLWLSGVVTSVEDQRTCLENVLAINPGNSRARSGLDFLNRQNPPPAPAPPVVPDPPAPVAPAAMEEAVVADNPTSVEWADYDEPVDDSGWHAAPPPPTEAYDEWVTGLQLTSPQAAPAPEADLFASPGGSSPFYGSEDDLAELTTGASLFDDDDPFGATGAAVALTAAATAPAPPPASSTITFRPPPVDDDEATPDSSTSGATASAETVATPAPRTAAGLADLSVEADEIILPENGELIFPDIPKEIKATRLPGTNERVPILLRLAVVVLAVLTFGSAVLFFWKVI